MWRQRLRWLKGAHLFLISPESVFFKKQRHMSFYQQSLYCLCPISHFIQFWAEPITVTIPFMCLILSICPYGMDALLFYSHFAFIGIITLNSVYYNEDKYKVVALQVKTGYRILWFTTVKAVINTIMVVSGFKPRGHFKFTPKSALAGEEKHISGCTAVLDSADSSPSEKTATMASIDKADGEAVATRDGGSGDAAPKTGIKMYRMHAALSRVTEKRRACMPMDGTLDIWVLMFFLALSFISAAIGFKRLLNRDAVYKWNNNTDSVLWIGIVFALVDCIPGLLFGGCASTTPLSCASLFPACSCLLTCAYCVALCAVAQERVAVSCLRSVKETRIPSSSTQFA
jgi:hypothetical protein